MADPKEYDLVVLGSGAPGKLLAWTLASRGQRVVVVERKYVGGSCPNIACLPSKNIIHSAKVASYFRRGREFGISLARMERVGHPLGRMGEIPEVVEAVLYLESAAFVSGETLHVDGGAHAGRW